jgi:hypothetical protein
MTALAVSSNDWQRWLCCSNGGNGSNGNSTMAPRPLTTLTLLTLGNVLLAGTVLNSGDHALLLLGPLTDGNGNRLRGNGGARHRWQRCCCAAVCYADAACGSNTAQ